MKKRKKEPVLGLLSVVIIALILSVGGKIYMSNKENENIENQRIAAIAFKKIQPGIEEIKFNQPGAYSGAGVWSVGARVIIDGKSYKEILVKKGIGGGDPLPGPNKNVPTLTPIKVIYSNGKEEIIK
ncbi:hypothetical protein [uncultured Streptococcus sp.]|uniref:hypothetical protein n=1 Tax=uncultured Streptococcus sp. TaxID=83427 RepID=UPI002598352D|nr:hypothetical protein [uncultured Streptococcus sp.]